MPKKTFEDRLFALNMPFRGEKRSRATDLREQIEESVEELGLDLADPPREMMVTVDKRTNQDFDYWLFDELLVQLDAGAGGTGIRKPINQLRVMTWRSSAQHLADTIKYHCRLQATIRYRRLFVMRLGQTGAERLDWKVYRK